MSAFKVRLLKPLQSCLVLFLCMTVGFLALAPSLALQNSYKHFFFLDVVI